MKGKSVFFWVFLAQAAGAAAVIGLVYLFTTENAGAFLTATAAVTVALVVVLVSVLLSRALTSPLARATRTIEHLKDGSLDILEPERLFEHQELIAAINDTAAALTTTIEGSLGETVVREQILSSMDEAVILAEEKNVVYANPAASRLFGIEDIKTLPPVVPVPPSGETEHHEVTLHHPNVRELRLTVSWVQPERILVVAQDVTETNRIDAVRRDFVANASHELKTPVAAIQATAETLEQALVDDPDAAKRFAASLAGESRRLSAMVQDLLNLARLEQQRDTGGAVPLSGVVASVTSATRARTDAAGLVFDVAIEPDLFVRGRSEDLELMVRNLLDNAIRYTPSGGKVRLEVQKDGEHAVVRVHDTGVGIPQRDLPRIFERFFRVDQARARDTGGTGLGLSIVRHIVESLGGSVGAESELGKGSTFTVTLRIAE